MGSSIIDIDGDVTDTDLDTLAGISITPTIRSDATVYCRNYIYWPSAIIQEDKADAEERAGILVIAHSL